MTNGSAPSPRVRFATLLLAVSLVALIGGCACNETGELVWDDGSSWTSAECSAEGVARRSQLWSEFAGRADPELLRSARRDAERECSQVADANSDYAGLK